MKFHKNAKLNLYQRAKINTSKASNKENAEYYGVHVNTIIKYKKAGRTNFEDRSHAKHNITYALTDIEQQLFLSLRSQGFGLDEIIDVISQRLEKDFYSKRATVHNLLKRHGVNRIPVEKRVSRKFKYYPPGYLHCDVTLIPLIGEKNKSVFLFVAIDRATRYMYFRVYDRQNQKNAADFMQRCVDFFPFRITHLLTDNGREFTNKGIVNPKGMKVAIKDSLLTMLCKSLGIHHRLTKPYTPQTNGMVERANRKIKDATIYRHRYDKAEDLYRDLDVFLNYYNTGKIHGGLMKEHKVRTPQQAALKLAG